MDSVWGTLPALSATEDFARLYECTWVRVFSICKRQLRDLDAACDATQAIYQELWTRVVSDSVVPTTARQVLHEITSQTIDRNRKQWRRSGLRTLPVEHALDTVDPRPSPFLMATQKKQLGYISSAISRLPLRLRRPVEMYYLQGFTQGEIAAMLGIRRETVAKRLATALRLLRNSLSA